MSAWTCLRVPNPGAGIELDWARRPHADCGDVSTAPASTFLRRLGPLGKSDCWDGRARALATGPVLMGRAAILDEEGRALRYGTQHRLTQPARQDLCKIYSPEGAFVKH